MNEIKYPDISVNIIGINGNAFCILGVCTREMRRHKLLQSEIDSFMNEATSGDYKLLDFYLECKLPQVTYEEKQAQIVQERQELEATAEKYRIIDADMKENVNKVMIMTGNIAYIFEQATTTDKQKLGSCLDR